MISIKLHWPSEVLENKYLTPVNLHMWILELMAKEEILFCLTTFDNNASDLSKCENDIVKCVAKLLPFAWQQEASRTQPNTKMCCVCFSMKTWNWESVLNT
ncbi:uncharacterized protein LOC122502711 [Leptopilina heterotoma]|uniref:uncharacterized protein LOC122502711 n=1 Tax=Leptopilina heterotoma TaxID=63436 RepID=UPI001CA9E6DC|nr:uncharacterized protein LOC122502711 [Leptopilina heterotoma]